MNIPVLISLL